jgi:hypothetical protein
MDLSSRIVPAADGTAATVRFWSDTPSVPVHAVSQESTDAKSCETANSSSGRSAKRLCLIVYSMLADQTSTAIRAAFVSIRYDTGRRFNTFSVGTSVLHQTWMHIDS